MRYLLITNNVIENAIEWDGVSEYLISENSQLIQSDEGSIGDTWPLISNPNIGE